MRRFAAADLTAIQYSNRWATVYGRKYYVQYDFHKVRKQKTKNTILFSWSKKERKQKLLAVGLHDFTDKRLASLVLWIYRQMYEFAEITDRKKTLGGCGTPRTPPSGRPWGAAPPKGKGVNNAYMKEAQFSPLQSGIGPISVSKPMFLLLKKIRFLGGKIGRKKAPGIGRWDGLL